MEKQHSYRKIEEDLINGSIKNVLLLYGKEQYLVKWAVDAILEKYIRGECRSFDFFEIDAEKATVDAIIENCETLSMFSEKRVVYLPGFALISGSKMKNIPESDEKILSEYINKIPDTCLLVITTDKPDKRKKLYKEIASSGGAYDFEPLDERTLRNFIEKHFKLMGKNVKPSVIGEFIRCSGYNLKETDYTLYNLENEIKKIAAHADGDEITLQDVLEVISGDVETNIFAIIDAVGADNKPEAFSLLHNMLSSGGSIFPILALLASMFETMLEVKELKDEGKLISQMQRILGIHEFRIKKAASAANAYSKDRLKDVLKKIYQVEKNIKTGLMDPVLALEMMLAEV